MKLYLPIILGTNRSGRQSEKVANLIYHYIKDNYSQIDSKIIDVKNFEFPADDYGPILQNKFKEYQEDIKKADGIIIVTPEYNHSYPGVLKSVLDVLYEEYNHKVAGIVSVSIGQWGGTRVVESLLPVLKALGLIVSKIDLQITSVDKLSEDKKKAIEQINYSRIDKFLQEIIWLGSAMKWGRDNL